MAVVLEQKNKETYPLVKWVGGKRQLMFELLKNMPKSYKKPLEILRRIILASTNENNLILDSFTGSSTTGIMMKVA